MYSRKIKLITGKKKSKTGAPPGSNWGPRIALAEKEKALLSQSSYEGKGGGGNVQLYQRRHQNPYSHPSQINPLINNPKGRPQHGPPLPPGYKKVSVSSMSSQAGSSSTGNINYIYNYARKASTSGSSGSGKSFYLDHPPPSSGKGSSSGKTSYAGSNTYILGSNSGSHVTLSTVGETVSQPLTLIIPTTSQRFIANERDQDSFPSTKTYCSTESEEGESSDSAERESREVEVQRQEENETMELGIKMAGGGILKLSSTQPLIHSKPKEASKEERGDMWYGNKGLDKQGKEEIAGSSAIRDLRNLCTSKDKKSHSIASTISSLAQGITMVYVPMESLPRSKSAAVLNASLEYDPELSELVNECQADTVDDENGYPSESEKDPDADSLLESFDSVMFKPKDDREPEQRERAFSSPSCSSSSSVSHSPNDMPSPPVFSNDENVDNRRCDKNKIQQGQNASGRPGPPPLPPKNPSMLKLKFNDNMFVNIMRKNCAISPAREQDVQQSTHSSPAQREISMRNAVEKLDDIIRSGSTTPSPTPFRNSKVLGLNDLGQENSRGAKRVTLSVPSKSNETDLLLHMRPDTDTEIDAYSSTFLTCGHVLKEDDYSTLASSTHSPQSNAVEMSDDGSPQSSQSSPRESDKGNEASTGSDDEKERNRSVLKQLRELSILIGGREEIKNRVKAGNDANIDAGKGQCKQPPKSFRLHENNSRKISDATDNSADSGKGSGSGSASSSNSSPKSFQSSPDSLNGNSHGPNYQCHKGVQSPCVFRSDCNECLMFNKPADGFEKPQNSEEICKKGNDAGYSTKSLQRKNGGKKTPSKLVRRKSSKSSKLANNNKSSQRLKKKKHLVLEYCDCSGCKYELEIESRNNAGSDNSMSNNNDMKSRKISTSSGSSGHSSIKLNRSVAFRSSSRSNLKPLVSKSCGEINGLFTIQEEENNQVGGESRMRKCSVNGPRNNLNNDNGKQKLREMNALQCSAENGGSIEVAQGSPHWHPNCWLAADPLLSGFSDLESLYSLNMKRDQPLSINGECWTCWQEISEIKRNCENPNATVDRTKRMFIWLNKRHKEFQAPWWEAKKQASIRWILTKALINVPKEYLIDPFKESKKSKPTKYRLKEEVIKGLVNGKLYSLALTSLYRDALGGSGLPAKGLCHWEIIKILSRRGAYVAQPSDMKLTEGTLRQKPIRIAAHIALIEAIMTLYSKEVLMKERVIATLYTFGCTVGPDTTSPEKLVIAWINAAVMTLKSYIVSTKNHQLSPEMQNRWIRIPKMGEIRDLCDGVGICCLFAIYCSNDLKATEISVPEVGETLTIYDSINNHTLIQKLCEELFPETIYHLCVTDYLYIHSYMKANVLSFLVDLYIHLELNPIVRVNRLTHVPVRVDLA